MALVAQRTCIACGRKAPKADLLRLVKQISGSVIYDGSGNLAGRGAYVCSKACFEQAREKGRIPRALRTRINGESLDAIAASMEKAQLSASAR